MGLVPCTSQICSVMLKTKRQSDWGVVWLSRGFALGLGSGGGFLVPGVYLGAHLTFIVFLKWPKNSAVQFEVNLISIRKSTMRQEKQERLHEAETALAVLSCPVLNTAIKQRRKDTYPFFCLFFFSFFYVPAIMPPFACLLLRPYPVADTILISPAPQNSVPCPGSWTV